MTSITDPELANLVSKRIYKLQQIIDDVEMPQDIRLLAADHLISFLPEPPQEIEGAGCFTPYYIIYRQGKKDKDYKMPHGDHRCIRFIHIEKAQAVLNRLVETKTYPNCDWHILHIASEKEHSLSPFLDLDAQLDETLPDDQS